MPPIRHQTNIRRTREASGARILQEMTKNRRRQFLELVMRGMPINQPGPSNIVNTVTPTRVIPRVQGIGGLGSVSGLLQPISIWSGIIYWLIGNDFPKPIVRKLECEMFRYVSAKSNDIETEFKVNTWPEKLLMTVLPKEVLIEAGGLKGSKAVMLCIRQCMALHVLRKHIAGDLVGVVKFTTRPSEPKCDVRAMVLWYMPGRKAYVGLIPKNQDTFMNRLREILIRQQNMINQPALAGGPSVSGQQPQQHAQSTMTGAGTGGQNSGQTTQAHVSHRQEEKDETDDSDDGSEDESDLVDDSDSDSDY